jgi:hypothetical protein
MRVAFNDLGLETAEFRNVLSAFSHWTYKCSNYNSVYVDFEGNLTVLNCSAFSDVLNRAHLSGRVSDI